MRCNMNISLTPALEKFVQEKLASGLYNSASEIIREALRLLFAQENLTQQKIDMLNKDIEKGLNDFSSNKLSDGNAAIGKLITKYE